MGHCVGYRVSCRLRSKPRTTVAHCVLRHCRHRTEWRTFIAMSDWPVSPTWSVPCPVSRRPRVSACEPIKCWHATCPPCTPRRRWSNECCHRFPHNTPPLNTNSMLRHCAAMALNHIRLPNPGRNTPTRTLAFPEKFLAFAVKVVLHVTQTETTENWQNWITMLYFVCYILYCLLWILLLFFEEDTSPKCVEWDCGTFIIMLIITYNHTHEVSGVLHFYSLWYNGVFIDIKTR